MEHDSSYFQPETLGAELAASVTRTYRLSQRVGTGIGHKTGMMGALDRAALARLTFPAGSYSRQNCTRLISTLSAPPKSIHESSARCRRRYGVHRR